MKLMNNKARLDIKRTVDAKSHSDQKCTLIKINLN